MRHPTLIRLLFAAIVAISAPLAQAMDMRFDVATDNSNGNDTDWFGSKQLPALNFTSVNGHNIDQGGSTHQSTIQAAGNTLGVYYDTFDNLYSSTETPAAAASTVQNWIHSQFGSNETGAWVVLNEVNGSVWDGSSGDAYRTWLVSTMQAMHNLGYSHIILFSSNSLGTSTYKSTWQGIAQYADVSPEGFIDGPTVQADNFSVSTLQQTYQSIFSSWTIQAGIPASQVIECEHFSVNQYAPSTYWGADGLSGTAWEEAIEARDIAIHNVPFGGFIGYAWDKDAQATGNQSVDLANQLAYEKAYASTLTVQTEVPTFTGNDGTSSWNDYLNWTGGLPSTTSAPFPLLASANPNLPLQTTANFLANLGASKTITLDGNESATNISFGNNTSYTIAPGTGGSLTITGSGASMSVTNGSHFITASTVVASNVAANLAGNLTISGGLTNNGYTLTKSGAGWLVISGPQSNAANSAISLTAGSVYLDTDAGSSTSSTVTLSASAGNAIFEASQHLASMALTGGKVTINSGTTTDIAGNLGVSSTGQILGYTNGISLDNSALTALSISGASQQITLDLTTMSSSGPSWGLRWAGDHVLALEADLNQNGFIGTGAIYVEANPTYFNMSNLTVGTMTDNGTEYTYIGFASAAPEPATFFLSASVGILLLLRQHRKVSRFNFTHSPSSRLQ